MKLSMITLAWLVMFTNTALADEADELECPKGSQELSDKVIHFTDYDDLYKRLDLLAKNGSLFGILQNPTTITISLDGNGSKLIMDSGAGTSRWGTEVTLEISEHSALARQAQKNPAKALEIDLPAGRVIPISQFRTLENDGGIYNTAEFITQSDPYLHRISVQYPTYGYKAQWPDLILGGMYDYRDELDNALLLCVKDN